MSEKKSDDLAPWIVSLIEDFIERSPENTLQNAAQEKAFENPLVGFSRGDDPLYESYKELVGPYHWTPLEIFALTFPDSPTKPQDLTVISWILPQTKATKADNRKEKTYPSERWARARIYGEEVNKKLRQSVVNALQEKGIQAMAPLLSPLWEFKQSEKYTFASNWSERHAAYAAGLGTFGLCDGLITPRGKAMRTGSVVAAVQIPPTPRSYTDHRAYCLFFSQGICGKCIPRCPVGALSETGHDKLKCLDHLRNYTADYVKTHYAFDGYGCGLCQTGVPCESRIPAKKDLESER
ncbi:MAG: epoxyqueuosine reductase [Deltaproteobacteria bacterium]|nr:epoxyqueuosine reductase [Deltaproteobacteria bacterium]